MDGRVFTLEDEIDVIHEDLGRARRRLYDLERAEMDGRVANGAVHRHTLRKAAERVAELELVLIEACADEIAAAEALHKGGMR